MSHYLEVIYIYIIEDLALAVSGKRRKSSPPHLIMILADDLGWNDVSWHNTLMLTPRMEVRNEYINNSEMSHCCRV